MALICEVIGETEAQLLRQFMRQQSQLGEQFAGPDNEDDDPPDFDEPGEDN
jgi:hypothetical protein